jgi:hypothetical protein
MKDGLNFVNCFSKLIASNSEIFYYNEKDI